MRIFKPFDKDIPTGSVATLGFFDGVHKGHQVILTKVKEDAEQLGTTPLIITLWPHPRIILKKDDSHLLLINSLDEKTSLIAQSGFSNFVVLPFSTELANYSAQEFFVKFFVEWLKIKKLIIGHDHRIGKNGEGDYSLMVQLGIKYGIEIEKIDALTIENSSISSTKVRNILLEGDVRKAESLLGYSYFITGKVEMGFQLGRKIGYPTANVKVDDVNKLIPADGVYAVEITVNNQSYQGMLNIGYRPTINNGQHKTIEVNIFDFDHSIYGEIITLRFIDRIRAEKKFDGLEALKAQLADDKKEALRILRAK